MKIHLLKYSINNCFSLSLPQNLRFNKRISNRKNNILSGFLIGMRQSVYYFVQVAI